MMGGVGNRERQRECVCMYVRACVRVCVCARARAQTGIHVYVRGMREFGEGRRERAGVSGEAGGGSLSKAVRNKGLNRTVNFGLETDLFIRCA